MVYLSKDKYEICMKKVKDDNESRERKRKLREEKRKYRPKIKLPSTSKLFLWIGFLLFVEIIFFCQYIAIKTHDTTPLVTMIGAIGGLISMFHTYSKKSTIENSRNGIIFETAMLSQQNINNDNTDSEEPVG